MKSILGGLLVEIACLPDLPVVPNQESHVEPKSSPSRASWWDPSYGRRFVRSQLWLMVGEIPATADGW